MAGRMLRGLTALAGGLSYKGQASLSKSQIGLHENPLFASPCGSLRKYVILVHKELSGNIRKAGLRGSAQESDGRDSTNRIDMAF